MKKYITPFAKTIVLSEESNLMFTASNEETTDTNYFSNQRETNRDNSIWDNE